MHRKPGWIIIVGSGENLSGIIGLNFKLRSCELPRGSSWRSYLSHFGWYWLTKIQVAKLISWIECTVDLSWKFWSGKKSGPGDQNSRKNGPPGQFSPENIWSGLGITVRVCMSTMFDRDCHLCTVQHWRWSVASGNLGVLLERKTIAWDSWFSLKQTGGVLQLEHLH